MREEIVVETHAYNLTVFKIHFGGLTFKAYTKGERTLRFEAIVHNARTLKCGRVLEKFPTIVTSLSEHLRRFLDVLRGVDQPFLADATWDNLPAPSKVGACRVGGVDINKQRMRAVMAAAVALSAKPHGFNASDVVRQVCCQTGQTAQEYSPTRAAYDLKKLRSKNLIAKIAKSRRYTTTPEGLRIMVALSVLCDKVLKPLLAGITASDRGPKAPSPSPMDIRLEAVRAEMVLLLDELQFAA